MHIYDFLSPPQANIVCRQLGFYSGAEEALSGSIFGPVNSEFSFSDVHCNGNEDRLEDCQSAPMPFCPPLEGAAVICNKTDVKGLLLSDQFYKKRNKFPH